MGITIVGLGPGNGRQLTREAWELLSKAEVVYLRTGRHPVVAELPPQTQIISFDHYYETAASFEDVYDQIVTELLLMGQDTDVVYAVPGHPFVGESTVVALVASAKRQGVPVTVVSGLSFVEPALAAVGFDGLDGLQLFDAIDLNQYEYPPINPDLPLLLGQVYNRFLASELKITLLTVFPDEHPVSLVHAAGTDNEIVESIPLYAIDRSERIDHLSSLFVPPLPSKSGLASLAETVAILRSPEGCPWDQEQTPQSMRAGFLEEVCEVLDALDAGDPVGLSEELGDVLYHIVMQVQMATESDEFKLVDVISGIETKLRKRHPHVWGDWEVENTAEVLHNWEMLKREEKAQTRKSLLDGVPGTLPALAHSQKIQAKVSKVGFDWPDIAGVFAKLEEEVAELKAAASPVERSAELGDILFVIANLARWLDLDAESSLREANLRFGQRFRRLEQMMSERDLDWKGLDLPKMDQMWEEIKEMLAKHE